VAVSGLGVSLGEHRCQDLENTLAALLQA